MVVTGWPGPPSARVIGAHGGRVGALAWLPATPRPRLASAGGDATLRVWDVEAHRCVRTVRKAPADPSALAVVGGGEGEAATVVVVGARSGGLSLWRPHSDRPSTRPTRLPWPHDEGGVTALAPSPGGASVVAVGTAGGGVWVLRVGGGDDDAAQPATPLWRHTGAVHGLAWAHPLNCASAALASGGADGDVVWGLVSGDDDASASHSRLTPPPPRPGLPPAQARPWRVPVWLGTAHPTPGTAWLGASGAGGEVVAWAVSLDTPTADAAPVRLPSPPTRPAFALVTTTATVGSSPPLLLAATSMDRTTRVWSLPPRAATPADWRKAAVPSPPLPGLGGPGGGVAVAGDAVAVGVGDGCVRAWRGGDAPASTLLWRGTPPAAAAVAWLPSSQSILAVGGAGVAIADVSVGTATPLDCGDGPPPTVAAVAWLPTGSPTPDLLALTRDGRLLRWAGAAADAAARSAGGGRAPRALPPADAAAELAAADAVAGVERVTAMAVVGLEGGSAALAVGGASGAARAFLTAPAGGWTRHALALPPHVGAVTAVAWAPAGGGGAAPWLACGGADGGVCVGGASAAAALAPAATAAATALAWTQCTTLAIGRDDGTIDVAAVAGSDGGCSATIARLRTLRRHGAPVKGVAWVNDADLLSTGDDHSVRRWAGVGVCGGEQPTEPAAALPPPAAPRPPRGGGGGWLGTTSLLPPPPPDAPVPSLAALATALTAARAGAPASSCPHPWASPITAAAALEAAADAVSTLACDPATPRASAHAAARRAAALRLWAGDPAGAAAELAASTAPPDADSVALAAAGGRGSYVAAARRRAAALEAAGDPHLASLYYSAAGDAAAAVAALALGGASRDAAALAAARTLPGSAAAAAAAAAVAPWLSGVDAAAAWLAAGGEADAVAALRRGGDEAAAAALEQALE